MSDALNRFAITALSRKNKEYAVPHEIMIHKEIGQIIIKTPQGDIISMDSLTRLQNHIENVSNRSRLANIAGDLFILELDFELPEIVEENDVILPDPVLIQSNPVTGVMFSIDLDSVTMSNSDTLVDGEPYIDLSINFRKTLDNNQYENNRYVISKKLSTINTMRIEPRNFLPVEVVDYSPYSLLLEGIGIHRDSTIYSPTDKIRNILHSIIVVTEGGNLNG